jgi:hypothetical protein
MVWECHPWCPPVRFAPLSPFCIGIYVDLCLKRKHHFSNDKINFSQIIVRMNNKNYALPAKVL